MDEYLQYFHKITTSLATKTEGGVLVIGELNSAIFMSRNFKVLVFWYGISGLVRFCAHT